MIIYQLLPVLMSEFKEFKVSVNFQIMLMIVRKDLIELVKFVICDYWTATDA